MTGAAAANICIGMRQFLRLIPTFVILALIAGVIAAVVVPGPQRAFFPGTFGLTEIAPNVWTDAPERAEVLTAMVMAAEATSAQVFSSPAPRPRTVLCATPDCRAAFGIPGRAITLADLAIVVAPDGLNPRTLLHERIHVELHALMGPLDALTPRFPSWFNEGLATHLSGTPAVRRPANPRTADWIKSADTPLAWRQMRRGRTPNEYYAASARLVEELDDRLGRDGLVALIERVARGADFGAEYRRILGH